MFTFRIILTLGKQTSLSSSYDCKEQIVKEFYYEPYTIGIGEEGDF